MSEDKLTSFLRSSGLLPKTENEKPVAGQKSRKKTNSTASKAKNQPARKDGSRRNMDKGGNKNGEPRKISNHNPNFGRPTHEKREKYHPTNYLKGEKKTGDIRIVPLGGLEQVGMNMMFIEWGDEILIIDTGLLFPDAEHLGVDVLVPNIEYLVQNKHKIKGVIYTHGHLDHIGGVPHIIPELGFPKMYATRLTKELILANTDHPDMLKKYKIMEITPESKIKLGRFEVEFFHINHSIPDGVGIVVNTPAGAIINTSDFKIDHNPSDENPADLGRIAQIGKKGVLAALVDSTNAMKPGQTLSESVVQAELSKQIESVKGRMIITTFASSIGRISKIVETAEKCGKTVFISGRSMEKNLTIARKLNYLKCKDGTLQRMSRKADKMDPSKVLILSTGSQGEPLAALTRMAVGTHRDITLKKEDTILFSSSPIIGNETNIVSVINNLTEIGCTIIDKDGFDVYVSGHGYADEVKLMVSLLNPKYFVPIHGELFMRHGSRDMIIKELAFPPENTFIMRNGRGLVLNGNKARLMTPKEAIKTGIEMIDIREKIDEHILRDRTLMGHGGAIMFVINHAKGVIKDLEIRAKGFRHMNMKHEIFKLLEDTVRKSFEKGYSSAKNTKALEKVIGENAQRVLMQKFRKEALIEVIVLD
ncbi:hypothetical protein CSB37_02030 [bacterium DOLZORAL124_38_8]|nr:MAG: hypothetical protein CSB37_02030 [bacterium DOLZORAL124_38_8]